MILTMIASFIHMTCCINIFCIVLSISLLLFINYTPHRFTLHSNIYLYYWVTNHEGTIRIIYGLIPYMLFCNVLLSKHVYFPSSMSRNQSLVLLGTFFLSLTIFLLGGSPNVLGFHEWCSWCIKRPLSLKVFYFPSFIVDDRVSLKLYLV